MAYTRTDVRGVWRIMQPSITKNKKEQGFTLMELAVGLLVASLIMAAGLAVYNAGKQQDAIMLTQQRMDRLTQVLAQYANANGRLPCPADPSVDTVLFGWERGVNQARLSDTHTPRPAAGSTCALWDNDLSVTENVGIVPYLSLGLKDEDARDGWGRYFTYAVPPVLAQINDDTNEATDTAALREDEGKVYLRCMTPEWVQLDETEAAASNNAYDDPADFYNNINSIKAKFCCLKGGYDSPYSDTDDIVMHFTQTPGGYDESTLIDALHPRNADNEFYNSLRDGTENYFFSIAQDPADMDPVVEVPMTAPQGPIAGYAAAAARPYENLHRLQRMAVVAYVIVSHGKNGYGAYLANNAFDIYLPSARSVAEEENSDGDKFFVEGPAGGPAGRFDDIVIWRTQISLMADAGASCALP
ncbi:MAG: prepilin-type N-terminal cleavage/methylation domain-containing protein [Alphaproteobacteria bacterium]|nr:prepilin-type N-terminal cleavage/methylation domain-containing protein [Alphaproteobacteria bacterium]